MRPEDKLKNDAGGHLRAINSPWGLAVAQKGFGKHADQLLVGNFGNSTIRTFEAERGKQRQREQGRRLNPRIGPF
jgi:hypothetical protein